MYKTIRQTTSVPLVRVDCYKEYDTRQQADFTFWVPTASLDELGWVPGPIIRARIKHHTGENQGHFAFQPG
jgi:hypothetical protein